MVIPFDTARLDEAHPGPFQEFVLARNERRRHREDVDCHKRHV